VTPLIAPPREITQTAPNRGKISKEFDIDSLLPRPPLHLPPGAPSQPRAPRAAVIPPAPDPGPAPVIEPPKVEAPNVAQTLSLGMGNPAVTAPPPPQIQLAEKPKLAFERPGSQSGLPKPASGGGKIAPPDTSVDEAVRSVARRGGGGLVVGDADILPGGIGEGLRSPGSPGRPGSSLELLSDPMGVDFKPYLIQILATVRRNWLAVIPETARLGFRGRVQIQFAISRDGSVPKLVIAMPSGLEALDRAAVAGISASNPFPPLPGEYRGNQVRLQFTFLYNMQR
jgi:TonB family protein